MDVEGFFTLWTIYQHNPGNKPRAIEHEHGVSLFVDE